MLVETIIFRPEDSILPGWEKFSTSGRRMQFFLGTFQLPSRRIEINLAKPVRFLLEGVSSTLIETTTSRPED